MITNPAEVTQVDFDTLAPQIIDEVAKALMPDRPIFHENDREIRFGNKGSFSVNKREGTFYDFESDTGGGILDMIAHVERLENRRQAFQWLRIMVSSKVFLRRPNTADHARNQERAKASTPAFSNSD